MQLVTLYEYKNCIETLQGQRLIFKHIDTYYYSNTVTVLLMVIYIKKIA